MAISKQNYVVSGLSGAVGHLLVFNQRAGKTVISKFPAPSSIPPTQKLRSVRRDFATCIAIAKAAIKDPFLKAKYQAAAKDGQTAFNVATSEALKQLRLAEQGTTGQSSELNSGEISKNLSGTTPVTVSVYNPAGELLKKGNSLLETNKNERIYDCTIAGELPAGSKISVHTTDLLGNPMIVNISLIQSEVQ